MRLFAGIALDEATRRACAAITERLRAAGLHARFEAPEKLHLTLAFLGNVEGEREATIVETMRVVATRHAPFTLELDRLGAFPHERAPRVIWLGSRRSVRAYRTLALDLQSAFASLGFSFDPDPVVHVTLARTVPPRAPLIALDGIDPIPVRVTELSLFRSLPANGTTRYEIRAREPLAALNEGE